MNMMKQSALDGDRATGADTLMPTAQGAAYYLGN
jgi:hypothetical protein